MLVLGNINIVPFSSYHLEAVRKIRNDRSTWQWLTSVDPISDFQQKEWFEHLQKDKTKMYLVAEDALEKDLDKRVVGILRSDEWDRTNRSVRIGVDIAPAFRGKGLGFKIFQAFIDYLFLHQNMHRIWFYVARENEAARGLYEKLGFKKEGVQREALWRDGKWHDYVLMSLLDREYFKRGGK